MKHPKAAFAALALLLAPALAAASPLTYTFQTHASFFSAESHQPTPLDPQVFVAANGAEAASGPQGIIHLGGLRPAPLDAPPSSPVMSAAGKPLGFTLGQWLAATGTVVVAGPAQRPHLAFSFHSLVPNGKYSLFKNHFAPGLVLFAPLDGNARTNSFSADAQGNASISLIARGPLSHANAILLVYHSDGKNHGVERGAPGIEAHHQLIMRFP